PAAAPPATVRLLTKSAADTLTDCVVLVVPSVLMLAPPSTNAFVVTVSSVTWFPPATPTKPPPALAARPNTFSFDDACTATPLRLVTPNPKLVVVPSRMFGSDPLCAFASIVAPPPLMYARVSLLTTATPMAAPTPTHPPARLAVMRLRVVSSFAETSTLSVATIATPVPVYAYVCVVRLVTATVPATPTVPPPAAAAIESI